MASLLQRAVPALGALLLALAALGACSRSGLELGELAPPDLDGSSDHEPDAGLLEAALPDADPALPDVVAKMSCPKLPPIPPPPEPAPLGRACTFSAGASTNAPVLAAIVGQDLIGLTARGSLVRLFHFEADASSQSTIGLSVVSRGDFLGALVAATSPTGSARSNLDVEFVLLRQDGTVLVHHRETFPVSNNGGGFRVTGNAAGTFAFSAAMGVEPAVSDVWLALADGTLLGPRENVYLGAAGPGPSRSAVEPDAKGRVLGWATSTAVWIDFCAGTQTPSSLLAEGVGGAAWGAQLFGVTQAGQLATETADGVVILPHAPLPIQPASFWDFVPPGIAMFSIPPYPPSGSATGNFLVVDAATLADHPASLAYPAGQSVVPSDAWLSELGDSNDPACFGLDSLGHVTMCLSNGLSSAWLETTSAGSDWTPVGQALAWDPNFEPNVTLRFVEAGGTYFAEGSAAGGPAYEIVRPASGVQLWIGGAPAHIARDGGCVAVVVSPSELDIVNATTGASTKVTLSSPVNAALFAATWIGGDDAVLDAPY